MPTPPKTANELRQAFTGFFAERGHTIVPSASLIPHDPTVLFTVAGMVPFKPYFTGDEAAPYKRAVSVQKCARAGGKHNDLDDVGRTKRHLVAFEMLGNFSFGDYFKADAIPWCWELVTERFGFDGDRLWITVHESDDEAEAIWHEQVGVPDGPHPAPRRQGQLLADGRDRPVRTVLRDPHRPRPGVRPRRRTARRSARRPVHGVLEPGLHAVQPGARRHADAVAPSRRSTPAPASSASSR